MDEKKLDPVESGSTEMELITLSNDTSPAISFMGKLVAENSFFDESSSMLTKQKLYSTADGAQAYQVVSTIENKKEKRSYLIRRQGEVCHIFNGSSRLTINTVDLLLMAKEMCGIKNSGQYKQLLDQIDELVDSAANE